MFSSLLTWWQRCVMSRRWPWALFAVAGGLRFAFVLAYGIDAPATTWGDDWEYDDIAWLLVSEGRYENVWYPPGYPLLLAAFFALGGHHMVFVRLSQVLLGAATCVLVDRLGRRCVNAPVGALAGAMLAAYPGHVYMSWRIMAEVPYLLLITLALLLAARLTTAPRRRIALGVALALGGAALLKSNLILLPWLLLLWLAWMLLRRQPRAGGPFLVFLVAFVLTLGATPVANLIASGGEIGVLPGNAGHTLWWSNNPAANGYFVDPRKTSDLEKAAVARDFIERHGMTEALLYADAVEDDLGKDAMLRDLALLWIREHPGDFLALIPRKLANAFGPLPQAAVFEGNPMARWAFLLSYGLALPFALFGLVLSRRHWHDCSVLYLPFIAYGAVVVIFYGTPRFTLAVVPFFLIFASWGVWRVLGGAAVDASSTTS